MFVDNTVSSAAQTEQPKLRKYETYQEYSSKYKTDEQKKEEVSKDKQTSYTIYAALFSNLAFLDVNTFSV
jgi:hypothetical protein